MTLLREIQTAASDSTVDLADLLRKCKLLAARLKHQEFSNWLSNELTGYSRPADVPDYRKVATMSLGQFQGPMGASIKNAPIPETALPEDMRWIVSEQVFPEPISTLAAHCAGKATGTLRGKWGADVVSFLQHNHQMIEGYVLVDAWRAIPVASIKGILDTIRTRVLDFVIAIEEQNPSAGEAQPGEAPRVAQEAVTNVFHTVIQGGLANIGTSGDAHITAHDVAFSTAVPAADREQISQLLNQLRGHLPKVQLDDRKEAADALAKVEAQLASPKPHFERMKKYLEIFAAIVTIATPVPVLIELLHRLFGV